MITEIKGCDLPLEANKMKYIVTVNSNFNEKTFESNSRNSIKHLRDNGGYECIVRNKSGEVISAARYNDDFGYYHVNIED